MPNLSEPEEPSPLGRMDISIKGMQELFPLPLGGDEGRGGLCREE